MRYATVTSWAKYFEEKEGVRIGKTTILRKLKNAEKIGITARNKLGRVFTEGFYSESDVRSACADLLQDLPQADENNFIEKDGIKYGTIKAWSRVLPISGPTVASRLKDSHVKSIKGKDKKGHVFNFYSESDIRFACYDLLQGLSQADENGFFEKDGIKYGSIRAWSKVLSVSAPTITSRLKQSQVRGVEGKNFQGHKYTFYPEVDVRSACADLLETELPQADEDRFFVKDGIKYGMIHSWSKVLPISQMTITRRLKHSRIKSIKGKDKLGRIRDFYSESDIRTTCADSLQEMPQADETGFFVKDGIKYGMIHSWSKVLPISHITIIPQLKHFQTKAIKGKDKVGHIRNFYSESDIRTTCADSLQEMPQADETGFFEKDGIKYGTVHAWSKVLSLAEDTITSRLKHFEKNSIKGKSNKGQIRNFFSEIDVRIACADLLQPLSQADEDGFFEKDGIKYGTIKAWSKILPVSARTISSRLKQSKADSIKGKMISGNTFNFYSESDVRSVCADFLQGLPRVDETGFFEKDDVKYGTSRAWSRVLPISHYTIIQRLKGYQTKAIKGEDITNQIRDFYSEIFIRIACSDLVDPYDYPPFNYLKAS